MPQNTSSRSRNQITRDPAGSRGRHTGLVLGSMLLSLLLSAGIGATTILGMDIDRIAQDAELVFEGEVAHRQTQVDGSSGIINTYVTFTVVEVIKGDFDGASLELKFAGGSLNGQIVEVSGLTIPALGEQGIYFVESLSRDLLNPLLGWSQGHFLISDETGERRVSTLDRRPIVEVQAVSSIPLAIKAPQKLIEGDGETAAGVMTETSSLTLDRALTVDEFKARIRALIED